MFNFKNKGKSNNELSKKDKKRLEREEYEKRVINYNRVVAIELSNRRKEKVAPKDSYISIQNVNKIYDNLVQAVFDFNLEIKKNEFIVLVGPSGCGKSTTLRMIAGLEEITSGNLFIDRKYANGLSPKDRDIAMVFQSYALYPHMSVYDNMAFSMKIKPTECPILDENRNKIYEVDQEAVKKIEEKIANLNEDITKIDTTSLKNDLAEATKTLEGFTDKNSKEYKKAQERVFNINDRIYEKGKEIELIEHELSKVKADLEIAKEKKVLKTEVRQLNKEEISTRVHEAAKILQIEEYLDRKPKALSGGQRQRVALGRAICKRAKLFLMDEPLSNLDAKLRVSMRSEIIRIHKAIGTTTIYVTHDQTEAMTMADRIVIMNKGYVQQIGTPKEIYDYPANVFVATFIGSPSMNILDVTIKDNKIKFDETNSLNIPDSIMKSLREKIEKKLDAINDFETNGLQEEYEKELNVKRETLRMKFNKTGYKVTHDEQGNIIDPIENATLDDYEKEMCQKMHNDKMEIELKKRMVYEEMLKTNVFNVKFGIRPENVFIKDFVNEHINESNELTLKVQIPELLGNEYYLHSELGNKDFIFKTSSRMSIKENDIVSVYFDIDRIHLFDSQDDELLI